MGDDNRARASQQCCLAQATARLCTLSRDTMQRLPFLKVGSAGGSVRKAWLKDSPLSRTEGGTQEVLTEEVFLRHKEQFAHGAKLSGLACLTQLSLDVSQANFRFQLENFEKIGRALFFAGFQLMPG